jgi:hypothetical protein
MLREGSPTKPPIELLNAGMKIARNYKIKSHRYLLGIIGQLSCGRSRASKLLSEAVTIGIWVWEMYK